MKKLIFAALTLVAFTMNAQVGVGTENPQATFQVVGENTTDTGTTGANTPGAVAAADGVLVPRVTNLTTAGTAANDGALVFLTADDGSDTRGFYYWSQGDTDWLPVGGSSSSGPLNFRTETGAYTVQVTDDIIEHTGTTPVNFDLPDEMTDGTPVGKIFYIANTGTGTISLPDVVTTAANNLFGGFTAMLIHLGNGRYAAITT